MIDKSNVVTNVVTNVVNGHVMYLLKNGAGIHSTLRNMPTGNMDIREPEFAFLQRKETDTDATFVDIGANVGINTFITAGMIKKHNGRGKVYAIEPDPRNIELLNMSVKANKFDDIVSSYQTAMGNIVGDLTFYTADATNLNSTVPTKHTSGSITVPCTTLTEFMKDKPFEKLFIKSDTEGAEVEILDGAMDLFDNNFPCKILIEVHPVFYNKERDFKKQLHNLLDRGFKIKYVASAAVAVPDKFKEHGYKPIKVFPSGKFSRGVYDNIKQDHAIEFASGIFNQPVNGTEVSPKIVRSILIERL